MSSNFGQLISHLAKKAGLPEDDAQLINLLSNAELTKVVVPQELYNSIDNKLLNVDDAKNNHPLIKAHYFAQAYNGLDSEVNRLLTNSLQNLLNRKKQCKKKKMPQPILSKDFE
jgi:hypothetical protein